MCTSWPNPLAYLTAEYPGAAALVGATTRVLRDRERATEMGKAGRNMVLAKFSAATEAWRLGQLFKNHRTGAGDLSGRCSQNSGGAS